MLHTPQASLLRALLGLPTASEAPRSPEYLWRYDPRNALHLARSRLRNYLRANGARAGIATTDAGYRLDPGRSIGAVPPTDGREGGRRSRRCGGGVRSPMFRASGVTVAWWTRGSRSVTR